MLDWQKEKMSNSEFGGVVGTAELSSLVRVSHDATT